MKTPMILCIVTSTIGIGAISVVIVISLFVDDLEIPLLVLNGISGLYLIFLIIMILIYYNIMQDIVKLFEGPIEKKLKRV